MFENTTFVDPSGVVYQGSQGIEILLDSKIMGYNPQKRPEIAENTSFVDSARVVYQGSQGIEILLGPENRGLLPTKTARNGRKHEFCRYL